MGADGGCGVWACSPWPRLPIETKKSGFGELGVIFEFFSRKFKKKNYLEFRSEFWKFFFTVRRTIPRLKKHASLSPL